MIGRQNEERRLIGEFVRVQPKVLRAYAWNKRTEGNRLLAIKLGGVSGCLQHINIDKAVKKFEVKTPNQQVYLIEVKIVGSVKKVKISEKTESLGEFVKAKYLQELLKKYYGQKINLGLDLKGVGISFIDETPEELLFLSLYEIKVQLQ